MTGAIDEHVATLEPVDLAEAELTMEEEYEAVLDHEQRWELEADGTLVPATDDPARERAWGADTRRAWGQP
jgi:hypothetical protein